jgi:hypothetical protein
MGARQVPSQVSEKGQQGSCALLSTILQREKFAQEHQGAFCSVPIILGSNSAWSPQEKTSSKHA